MSFIRFVEDTRGGVIITFALGAVVLLGVAGVALDYSIWTSKRSTMQTVADAAALAGAHRLGRDPGANSAEIVAVAQKYISEKLGADAIADITVDGNTKVVDVALSAPAEQTLSKLVTDTNLTLRVESAAAAQGVTAPACIIALDPTSAVGIDFGLSGSMTANGCAIWSNSVSPTSINANGSGTVTSARTCAAGEVSKFGIAFSPELETKCPPVADPLADWSPPTKPINCKKSNAAYDENGFTILEPGVYCGGIKANGNTQLYMAPGEYTFTDGPVVLSGGASVIGLGVSMWFTGSNAYLDLSGSASVALSAPTSGAWAGMLIVSGRNESRLTYRIRGNTSLFLQGNVYLPTHHLNFSGGPDTLIPPDFTTLIAGTIAFGGSSQLEIRSDYSGSSTPAYTAPTASGTAVLLK